MMTALDKARSVVALVPPRTFVPSAAYDALGEALREHIIGLTGDADRELARVEVTVVERDGRLYEGFSARGVRRLWCPIWIRKDRRAELAICVTKGNLEAREGLFGEKGKQIGNALVVARLLHIAIVTMRAGGVLAVDNEPFNPGLAAHYRAMGFEDDRKVPSRQALRLDDLGSLAKAFSFVEATYEPYGLSLASPP